MSRQKYFFTPEMDAAITSTYLNGSGNGEIKALALRLMLPRWRVTKRAIYLGVVKPAHKEPNWTEKEIRLLTKWAQLSPDRISMKFKEKGFHRSGIAIVLKRRRLRLPSNLEGMSAYKVAEAFGVDNKTVARWIELSYLRAGRRGTNRKESQGGDSWWIVEEDIKKFIIESVHIIDFRKVNKYWLVDVLTNGK